MILAAIDAAYRPERTKLVMTRIDHVVCMRKLCANLSETVRKVCAANAQIMSSYIVN